VVLAAWFLHGTATVNLIKWFGITSIFLNALEHGSTVRKSVLLSPKEYILSIFTRGSRIFTGLFLRLQRPQCSIQELISYLFKCLNIVKWPLLHIKF
jgi:hypothetical protein